MASKKTTEYDVRLEINCASAVGYYMLRSGAPPINRLYVKNLGEAAIEDARVEITSSPEFLLPYSAEARLPGKSTLRFEPGNIVSPLFTAAQNERGDGTIAVRVIKDGATIVESVTPVVLTAFNECDFSARPELLAAFVTRSAALKSLGAEIDRRLDEWKRKRVEFYEGSNVNDVRYYFAAAYSVLCEKSFLRAEAPGEDKDDIIISGHEATLRDKTASEPELALLFAAMLENAGIHCVFGRLDGKWYVGAFLTDDCFASAVIDEPSLVANRTGRGVNELSLVCVSGIFGGVSFERNERLSAADAAKAERGFFVDLTYARISGVKPLPERVKRGGGYDLVESDEYDFSVKPRKIREMSGDLGGETVFSREKQWERRLLDLDMRNPLLNFRPSGAVRLLTADLDDLIRAVTARSEFELAPTASGEGALMDLSSPFDGASPLKPVRDLINYEYKAGKLRVPLSGKDFDRALTAVYRKEKSRQEESGAASLFLAAGFLRWKNPEDDDFRYAPVLLYPVTMTKKGASSPSFSVAVQEDDIHVNTTLLEYLYRCFDVDLRALGEFRADSPEDYSAAVARIRSEIAAHAGFTVTSGAYLCSLSFSGYRMWKDVRTEMDGFRSSRLIRALTSGQPEFTAADALGGLRSVDEAIDEDILLPIGADSSQYSAVADSLDKSFVLHGPPGTGKSQTITNIIANNIYRGKRVLFVAEKMAALSVVYNRLRAIGIGDFCLELYSEKTKKSDVIAKISHTLALEPRAEANGGACEEIAALSDKLGGEMRAMHEKKPIGFSVYEAATGYLQNADAPDCFTLDSLFYEKLTREKFSDYAEMLSELTLCAKECGALDRSPFRYINVIEYTPSWRKRADMMLDVYARELRSLRFYARALVPHFNMRTVAFTREKLQGLSRLAAFLSDSEVIKKLLSSRENIGLLAVADSLIALKDRENRLKTAFAEKFTAFPEAAFSASEVIAAGKKDSAEARLVKRYASSVKYALAKPLRGEYFQGLVAISENRLKIDERLQRLSAAFGGGEEGLAAAATEICEFAAAGKSIYAEFDERVFFESCRIIVGFGEFPLLRYYAGEYERAESARADFERIFEIDGGRECDELNDEIEYVAGIQKNMDKISGWCRYREVAEKCRKKGFEFVLEPLALGDVAPDDVLACFKKRVYAEFVKSEVALDDRLCRFSGLALEEAIERLRAATDEYEEYARKKLYNALVSGLPSPLKDGEHNLERVLLARAEKTGGRGVTLRKLFTEIPTLMKAACPCMLMSPSSVAQFLDSSPDKFDLVVFDEASQVPTAKAVGAIARAERVIVVGDPRQLPPTTFFGSDFRDEEHPELEDLESILDDCLAVGMPERHLLWHYRSHHESLIAFSNAFFYDNRLLTFPSPGEADGRVSMCYVDGVYDRGDTRCNAVEADALIADVIARLKSPVGRARSVGVVTFSTAQQAYIEDKLTAEIARLGLEKVAYECPEPLFVKNLENVQGDERDVILFSVGYGPDRSGKLSLNFGPLNQTGGERRLNVAVTRARTEMRVFSSVRSGMIDLARTSSKGVKCLKYFLEYAERGREMLAIDYTAAGEAPTGIGKLVADALTEKGLKCDCNVGVSDFKIDAAVVDPRDKSRYILAIVCDGENQARIPGVLDRASVQTRILKTLGWNIANLWTLDFFANPKREIARIKALVAALAGTGLTSKKAAKETLNRYKRAYKRLAVRTPSACGAEFVATEDGIKAVKAKAEAIIKAESPVAEDYLTGRLRDIFRVLKTSKKACAAILTAVRGLDGLASPDDDGEYRYASGKTEVFRPLDDKTPRDYADVCPEEIAVAARCALELYGSCSRDALVKNVLALMNAKKTAKTVELTARGIDYAVRSGIVLATVDGNFTS